MAKDTPDIYRPKKKETVTSTGEGTHTDLGAAAAKLEAERPPTARELQIAEMERKAAELREKRRQAKEAKDGDVNKDPVNPYKANPHYRMKKVN